jgi:hypothetical protein
MFDDDNQSSVENIESQTAQEIGQRIFNTKLMALRAQHPFVPIFPLPNSAAAVQLQPNTPVDIHIPAGTKLIFTSGDQVYYLSRNGKAQTPQPLTSDLMIVDRSPGCFQNPEGTLLYVEDITSISVISPVVCNFTCGFYAQL